MGEKGKFIAESCECMETKRGVVNHSCTISRFPPPSTNRTERKRTDKQLHSILFIASIVNSMFHGPRSVIFSYLFNVWSCLIH